MRVRMNRVYNIVGGIDLMLSEAICQARVCMRVFSTLMS